jgi:hypothetical protein
MTDWEAQAAKILASGYVQGNQWEQKLRRHLQRSFPKLMKELGADLDGYLIVRVAHAQEQQALMLSQGMSPDDARTQALADLLPTPPAETNRPQPWETQGPVDGSLQGQINYLLSLEGKLSSPKPPPPKTPTT